MLECYVGEVWVENLHWARKHLAPQGMIMVFSLVTLAATVPLIATSTIQLQDQSQRKQEESEVDFKTEKCHLVGRASPRMSPKWREQLRDMRVVLQDGYIFLEPKETMRSHPFTGYFLPYPETSYDGIVTAIDSQNMLNWIFVNKTSYQVQHGVRLEAQLQLTGPMTLVFHESDNEWRVAFEGWEGFVAVKDEQGRWAVYFDKGDNGLAGKIDSKVVVEIELVRSCLESQEEEGVD